MEAKFGPLPDGVRERIEPLGEVELKEMLDRTIDAVSLDEALSDAA